MKNRIILCLGCLLAFLQLRAQVNTNQQHLCNPNSFSIVLLGDPQNYVKYDYNQPVFELMTAWTAHHIDSLRVKAVLCMGDLVDQCVAWGLVQRTPDPLDARAKRIVFTDTGLAWLAAFRQAVAQAEAEFREQVGTEVATVVALGLEAYAHGA